ncbi:glycosyltransferase family 4 protein [Vicingaceae bacterium]|nr:glycosyltransferase family 4 protein [Vicingaceae bacterium]MDB4060481.1 glycosyltransferase family 4 protein [Vicingaceae bacterium]
MLVFRKSTPSFHSIENVFETLLPFLDIEKVVLKQESKGILNRLKNIFDLLRYRHHLLHITGNDNYLLCFPFAKAILTIHDIEALKRKRGVIKMIFKYFWFTLPIKNAKVITTISEFSKNEIQGLFKKKISIRVIQNPLTLNLDYSPSTFNELSPKILLIGTKKNKNLERLIQAVIGLPCELIIVGSVENEVEGTLIENEIKYSIMYNLSNTEIVEQYIECDFVCFVSTYEGFGLPILEAQAIGRPTITSNISPMKEVAGGGSLLVDPLLVQEIRKGINTVIKNKELRLSLVEKGRINVKKYDPKIIALKYQSIYNELGDSS